MSSAPPKAPLPAAVASMYPTHPLYDPLIHLLQTLKLQMSRLHSTSLCTLAFNKEAFLQMAVLSAHVAGLNVKQCVAVVVDGVQERIDMIIEGSTEAGPAMIVDLGYLSFVECVDLEKKKVAGGDGDRRLDPANSLVETYLESHASRSTKKLHAVKFRHGKSGVLRVDQVQQASQARVDEYFSGIKWMGGIIEGRMQESLVGVSILGVGNAVLVSTRDGGQVWTDRTDEMLEPGKAVTGRPVRRMGSTSSVGSVGNDVVEELRRELESVQIQFRESQQLVFDKDSELDLLRWDAASLVTVTDELKRLKSSHAGKLQECWDTIAERDKACQDLQQALDLLKEEETSSTDNADNDGIPSIAKVRGLESDLLDLQNLLAEKELEILSLKLATPPPPPIPLPIEITSLQSQIVNLTESLSVKDDKITQLESKMESAKKLKSTIAAKDDQIAQLESKLESADKLKSTITTKDDQIANLESSLATTTANLTTLTLEHEHRAKKSKKEKKKHANELESLRTALDEAVQEGRRLHGIGEAMVAETEERLCGVQVELEVSLAECQRLRGVEARVQDLEEQLRVVQLEKEGLVLEAERLKAFENANLTLSEQLQASVAEVESLRALEAGVRDVGAMQQQADLDKESIRKLEMALEDAVEVEKERAVETRGLVEQLEGLRSEMASLMEVDAARVVEMEVLLGEKQGMMQEVEKRKKKLRKKEKEVESLEERLRVVQMELQAAIADVERLVVLEERVDDADGVFQQVKLDQEMIAKLEAALAEAVEFGKSEAESLRAQVVELQSEMDETKQLNVDMVVAIGTMRGEKDGLEEDLGKSKRKWKKKEKEMSKRLEGLDNEVEVLKGLVEAGEETIRELMHQLANSSQNESRVRQLESQVDAAQKVVSEQKARIFSLEAEMARHGSVQEALVSLRETMASMIDNTVTVLLDEHDGMTAR
ncbi:hypothetical protein HDU98_000814 [Podochytrium sp. JEL0797]|nr:hypothetical protein HDU98_000814 [Podochytrium sp. JEL0797]